MTGDVSRRRRPSSPILSLRLGSRLARFEPGVQREGARPGRPDEQPDETKQHGEFAPVAPPPQRAPTELVVTPEVRHRHLTAHDERYRSGEQADGEQQPSEEL